MASTRFRWLVAGVALVFLWAAVGLVASQAPTPAPTAERPVSGGGEGVPGDSEPLFDGSDEQSVEQGSAPSAEPSETDLYEVDQELQDAAADVVMRYQDEGDCIMGHAGYVDLAGNVWSCLVVGPGWVDVCVVSQEEGSRSSRVKTVRMEVGQWREEHGLFQEEPGGPVER